jgi:hypothetical protein
MVKELPEASSMDRSLFKTHVAGSQVAARAFEECLETRSLPREAVIRTLFCIWDG